MDFGNGPTVDYFFPHSEIRLEDLPEHLAKALSVAVWSLLMVSETRQLMRDLAEEEDEATASQTFSNLFGVVNAWRGHIAECEEAYRAAARDLLSTTTWDGRYALTAHKAASKLVDLTMNHIRHSLPQWVDWFRSGNIEGSADCTIEEMNATGQAFQQCHETTRETHDGDAMYRAAIAEAARASKATSGHTPLIRSQDNQRGYFTKGLRGGDGFALIDPRSGNGDDPARPDQPTAAYCLIEPDIARWKGTCHLRPQLFQLLRLILESKKDRISMDEVADVVGGSDKSKTRATLVSGLSGKLAAIEFPWIFRTSAGWLLIEK